MGLGCGAEVSDRKGNKVSGQSVRLTDEQRIDWLRLIRSSNLPHISYLDGFGMSNSIKVTTMSRLLSDFLQRWPVSKRVNSSKADADAASCWSSQ